MGCELIGRKYDLKSLKKYAENSNSQNCAFFGVKGVGKTSLFNAYLSREKRKELADNYKKIFAFATIEEDVDGKALHSQLLKSIKNAMSFVDDEIFKDTITGLINSSSDSSEALPEVLTEIKDWGYHVIVVMDHFHCMTSSTKVGIEQYGLLRRYQQSKLADYWLISDLDLSEEKEDNEKSFFAQTFTKRTTIYGLDPEYERSLLDVYVDDEDFSEEEKQILLKLCGGIPDIARMISDIATECKRRKRPINEDFEKEVLSNNSCISLFNSWLYELKPVDKKCLYEVASNPQGIYVEKSQMITKLFQRGLVIENEDEEPDVYHVNLELFRKYILSQGEEFYLEKRQELKEVNTSAESIQPVQQTIINNNYYGDITNIDKQQINNNVVNIENAVTGLEDLQKLILGNPSLTGISDQIESKLSYLPFNTEEWIEMSEEEKETETKKYADDIFESAIFTAGELSNDQRKRFLVSEELMGSITDSCRNQISCGIQIYDLIDLCIKNFGLTMESESPRGILFARAYERHLKDFVAPAYKRIPRMANKNTLPKNVPFKNADIDETTIGTYFALLNSEYRRFAHVTTQILPYPDKDVSWWMDLKQRLYVIKDLRNDCCHSGHDFKSEQLNKLVDNIFIKGSIGDILIFDEIPQLNDSQFII